VLLFSFFHATAQQVHRATVAYSSQTAFPIEKSAVEQRKVKTCPPAWKQGRIASVYAIDVTCLTVRGTARYVLSGFMRRSELLP